MKVKVKLAKKEETKIDITTEFIRLDCALKLANAVESGGHAKVIIQDGQVKVNGEVCTVRGKKLHRGDSFQLEHRLYIIQ